MSDASGAVVAEAVNAALDVAALQRKEGYAVGDVLDVRDTVNKWMEGKVVQLDSKKGYFINYLGWSEKWNEWVPKNSNRLAPYRSYTTKSTAPQQNAGAFQLEGDNLVQFRATAAKLTPLVAKVKSKCEARESSPKPKDVKEKEKEAAAIAAAQGSAIEVETVNDLIDTDWALITGEVCPTVNNVLNAVVHDSAVVPEVVKFLLDYLSLFIYLMRMDKEGSKHAVLESFVKVLNADSVSFTDKRLFTKYGVTGNETFESGNKGKWAIRPKATGSGDQLKITSAYLIQFINFFGDAGGFDLILKKLSAENDAAPSYLQYMHYCHLLVALTQYFDSRMTKKLIPAIKFDVKTMLQRVRELSEDELKCTQKENLRLMTNRIIELLQDNKELKVMKPSEAADKLQMSVVLRLLTSKVLEKRINGVIELQDHVKSLRLTQHARNGMGLSAKAQAEKDALPTCHTTHKTFLEWVDQSGVVQLLLAPDSHEEILKRSPAILKYLAANNALSVEPIFQLFDSVLTVGGKHEALVRTTLDVIADIASELSDAALNTLLNRLNSIPKSSYTETYVQFLKSLAVSVSRSNVSRAAPLLDMLWQLITSSDVSVAEWSQMAMQLQSELLSIPTFEAHRVPFIERTMNALKSSNTSSVPLLLRMLTNILSMFPVQSDSREWNQNQLILALQEKMALFSVFFDELGRYHQAAKAVFAALPADERPIADPKVGQIPHSAQVRARLEFVRFLLEHAPKLVLPAAQVDILWKVLYCENVSPHDRVALFIWLMSLIDDGGEVPANARRRYSSGFTDDVTKHTFQLLIQCDFDTLPYEGYRAIELYFCYVNFLQGGLSTPAKKQLNVVNFDHILGLERLWLLAATVADKKIAIASRLLLIGLYTKLDGKLWSRRTDYYSRFLDRCLTDLQTYSAAINAQNDVQLNTRICLQYLTLLDGFLLQCDKLNAPEEPPASSPPPGGASAGEKQAKEAESNAAASDPSLTYHRYILSNNQQYFNLLFELLTLGGEIASRVWGLLIKLPTNQELERTIVSIAHPASEAAAAAPIDWGALLSSNTPLKLLYILQLIHSHLRRQNTAEQMRNVEAWTQVFLVRGGFQFVYSFVTKLDVDAMVGGDALQQQCLASLLKLLNVFMAFPIHSQAARLTDAIIDQAAFIPLLIHIIERGVQHKEEGEHSTPNTEAEIKSSGLVFQAFQLLSYCLVRVPSGSPLLQIIPNFPNWDSILQAGLLSHPSIQLRDQVSRGVEILCSESPFVAQQQGSEADATATISNGAPQILTSFFLPKLLQLLRLIQADSPLALKCLSYFEITRKLLGSAAHHQVPLNYESLAQELFQRLQEHPIVEKRATDEDWVLGGLLQLLMAILRQRPALKETCLEWVKEVYSDLFTLPSIPLADSSASNSASTDEALAPPLAPPKCKSPYTRRAAFRLLQELVFGCPTALQLLVDLLTPLHLHTHSNNTQLDEWEFESKSDDKSECGYVGLRNLGSTCYLGSTVQQFFMIPAFRYYLLKATPAKEEPLNTSVLFQLQYLMAFLQESEKHAFDPKNLCSSFTDFEGNPLNVGLQEDAAGFVTRLVDKLMDSVRGTPYGAALKSTIFGQTADQFIGHPPRCSHYKERSDDFPTIPLTVRNMKTIQDSLKSFVQGEVMEGSNAYKCTLCDAKVNTTKRTVFKSLPPTLIFNLSRFSMDYERMVTIKINDRIEFPMSLNMKPYTKEGIREAEKAAKAGAESPTASTNDPQDEVETHPPEYYEYELTGVTVHTGSMDRGHYYSFICVQRPTKEQAERGELGKWVEFNDTVIRPFDPRNIPSECFGGLETIQQFNAAGRAVEQTVEKQRNAYLLFYTSKRKTDDEAMKVMRSTEAEAETAVTVSGGHVQRMRAPIPPSIFQAVWEQNRTYWRDRYVFDAMYFEFLHSIAERTIAQPSVQDAADSANEDPVFASVTQLSTRFVLETLCRARQKQRLSDWSVLLSTAYRRSSLAGRWFVQTMSQPDNKWVVDILLSCPIVEVRQALAELICLVMDKLAPSQEKSWTAGAASSAVAATSSMAGSDSSTLIVFISSLVRTFKIVPELWRRFNQFFRVIVHFAKLNVDATSYLLNTHDMLARLIDLYIGEVSPLADNPFDMPTLGSAKKRTMVGDTLVRPDVTALMALFSRLVCASTPPKADTNPPTRLQDALVPLSPAASQLLMSKAFLARLLQDATSRRRGEHINRLLTHVCWMNMDFSKLVIGSIVNGIKAEQVDTLRPYFRIIGGMMQINDSLQLTRQEVLMASLLLVMESQAGFWKPTEFCLEHLLRLAKKQPSVANWLQTHPAKLDWIQSWLKAHPSPPRQGEPTLMHKPGRIDPVSQLQSFHPLDFAAFAPKCWPSLHHSTAQKSAYFERIKGAAAIDDANATDSDEELSERQFHAGQYVDALDTVNHWLVAKVVSVQNGGKTLLIHYDNWHPKFDEHIPADSVRITKLGRFTNGVIVEKPVASESTEASNAEDAVATGVGKMHL